MSTIMQGKPKQASEQASELMTLNVRSFIEVKSAYEQCSLEIRRAVDDMVDIVKSQDATLDEKNRAVITIVEALFPSLAVDFLAGCEQVRHSPAAIQRRDEMRREEESFAEKVQEIMAQRELTQDEVGKLAGVGQSAISNMLTRKSRPQRRTVVKIAGALGVEPKELWPGIEDGELG